MIHDSTCNVYNDVVIGVTLQVLSAYTFILMVIDDVYSSTMTGQVSQLETVVFPKCQEFKV